MRATSAEELALSAAAMMETNSSFSACTVSRSRALSFSLTRFLMIMIMMMMCKRRERRSRPSSCWSLTGEIRWITYKQPGVWRCFLPDQNQWKVDTGDSAVYHSWEIIHPVKQNGITIILDCYTEIAELQVDEMVIMFMTPVNRKLKSTQYLLRRRRKVWKNFNEQ